MVMNRFLFLFLLFGGLSLNASKLQAQCANAVQLSLDEIQVESCQNANDGLVSLNYNKEVKGGTYLMLDLQTKEVVYATQQKNSSVLSFQINESKHQIIISNISAGNYLLMGTYENTDCPESPLSEAVIKFEVEGSEKACND